ncbi:site-specific recombinase, phage integrase family [Mobiluncus mulieris ATCC 35239]|uniref:Site-specific recombinase, phage integrase family n=1 Tax=Mobiluncus mulieris ATCC 35239 TaxID=871571 RepID=E0QP24_9ACTO|nr:site-specific integrase [Mobiluncus mulieris]EFM46591.1 site-specific recombinase, phage integrase family [Mobiluncus mulieris ATCC 35239]MCU9994206.1 site-specific integrase [Mobiluncus mulieris]MCV0012023.1 site-specific integrase [Mobiluncus mulieris]PNL40849.1 site-specific integrase [Mobiluncus mulieris]PNL42508.1 site-specific integrase [Mobiluncus mulieris]
MQGITEIRHKDGRVVYRVRFRDGKTNASETFRNIETATYFRDLVKQFGGTAARNILDSRENPDDTDTLTLGGIHQSYLEHAASYATPGTIARYRNMAASYIFPKIPPQTPIRALTRESIENYVTWLRAKPSRYGTSLKPRTIKRIVAFLSTLFNYQIEIGNLESNPARGIRIPNDAIPTQPVFLTPQQVEKIADNCGYYGVLVRFLYATGLRFGEATALTPADVNVKTRTITVSKAWKQGEKSSDFYLGSPKTDTSTRTVLVSKSVIALLKPLLVEDAPFLFHPKTRPDRPLRNKTFRNCAWKQAVENMDPRPRIHDLRHSHVSRLIQAGIPLPVIQKRVGHKDIQTTINVYGHITPKDARAAADVFG